MDRPTKDLQEPANQSMLIGSTHAESHERREDVAVTRREFIGVAMASSLFAGTQGGRLWAAEETSGIPYRTLGRTGEKVSIVGLGGYHLGSQAEEQESIRIIRTAIDSGIN